MRVLHELKLICFHFCFDLTNNARLARMKYNMSMAQIDTLTYHRVVAYPILTALNFRRLFADTVGSVSDKLLRRFNLNEPVNVLKHVTRFFPRNAFAFVLRGDIDLNISL